MWVSRLAAYAEQPVSGWKAYGLALALVGLAALCRLLIDPIVPRGTFIYLPYIPLLAITTFFCGLKPAMLGSVVIGTYNYYYYLKPVLASLHRETGFVTLMLFLGVAGSVIGIVGILRSALVRVLVARQEVADMAAKRELLLRELQHRVKNNLQLVASLLILQKARVTDQTARRSLDETSRRISILASIHHDLYRLDGMQVNPRDLIERIVDFSVSETDREVRVDTDICDVLLEPNEAIPLGLIANELIANAVEHGILKGGDHISVKLSAENNTHTLVVRDNGPGLPPGFDPETCDSFGLTIVLSLVAQLGGTYSLRTDHGTVAELTFQVPEKSKMFDIGDRVGSIDTSS